MSSDQLSHSRTKSSSTKNSAHVRSHTPPPSSLTPENTEQAFESCAATGSFFLYAQRNVILVLHHDTLAIERRFELHREDVKWITVDNVSERGAGRLAASYDAGHSTIVWDILTGREIARFAAYEEINTAQFMRNGNIAFGNLQGSVILFEPSTHENISARTIFDPITAIAPSADCRTFAIGYLNGSILIATLQPAFTILHTLTTSRAPSRITGLAWHGSSSKQKTDMLATQTAEGDLRVWSVPKTPHHEAPTIIRALGRSDIPRTAPCWFGWSKNGRIVQHYDGETRSWDVRTKRVTYDLVPTIEGVVGIASYGPTATLFTMGRNHTIQQYDISPTAVPLQVQSVQHMPANTPPTPPTTLEERKNPYASSQASSNTDGQSLPIISDMESSADEGNAMSPLQKIAREMDSLDQLESEVRDKITPLSPTSSRASSVSSRSSGGAHRQRKYLYDRPSSSRASTTTGYEGTEFSYTGEASKPMRDSMSIRSESTRASHTHFRSSSLRKEILRSPEEAKEAAIMDLFPYTKARLRDVALQTPHYGDTARTPEILQREMLSVVFGWNDTVETLIREEMARHKPGSASNVLLAKWLSDMGADSMAALVGSESMTSSDWMLLALSSIGQDSQKKVGEAFVQRLLEKGDIHPAVAILLGLGETHDAIEVYVSQGYFMEAILLTSLTTPSDWGRQTYLLRKWGEIAIRSGEPELAVRIFSCASIETTTAWTSPGAQNAVFAAQHQQGLGDPLSPNPLYSPPLSPPSRSGSGRLTAKNASLKLITTFGAKGAPVNATNDDPTPLAVGLTPILTSVMSPIGWRPTDRNMRAPSSARTATPGAYGKRRRLPSKSDATRTNQVDAATPLTAARDRSTSGLAAAGTRGRRTPSISDTDEPATALRPTRYDGSDIGAGPQSAVRLPSPSHGLFARSRTQSRPRQMSRDRHPDGLKVQIVETRYTSDALSPGPSTQDTSGTGRSGISRMHAPSPAMTNSSMRSAKTKAIDDYINSVEQARLQKRHARPESRTRGESRARTDDSRRADSRSGRATSRARDRSEARGRADVHYIKPPKRSPSSPVPMSPEEIAQANARQAAANDPEHFYKTGTTQNTQADHSEDAKPLELTLQNMTFQQRKQSPDRSMLQVEDSRGRSDMRTPGSLARSPSTPLPSTSESRDADQYDDTQSDGRRIRSRAQSIAHEDLQTRRAASRSRPPVRSESCRSNLQRTALLTSASQLVESTTSSAVGTDTPGSEGHSRARTLTRKELAARELEERRLSLARRPSAPAIPMPNTLTIGRPRMSPRSHTELGDNPHTLMPPISRSQTADPEAGFRYGKINGTSTPSAPIGLPATPRAMKHPQYMGFDPDDSDVPPVPLIPDYASSLTGSLLSQTASSSLSQAAPSSLSQAGPSNPSQVSSSLVSEVVYDATEDTIAPLLPSTVFGKQGPQAPPRAASAPLEKSAGSTGHPAYKHNMPTLHSRRFSGGRGHVRKISPPEQQNIDTLQPGVTSIDEAIHNATDQHVIIVETDGEDAPIMLPELQHLAMPPPPPPPALYQYVNQRNSDHIEVVVDVNASTTGTANSGTASDLSQAPTSFPQFPYSMERASTASPQTHRRGHGSISESFGSRMRGVADRMRNGSRSRAKSPPMLESLTYDSPYETVLPPFSTGHLRRESFSRAKSPYEQAMAEQQNAMPPPPPPPPAPPAPGTEARLHETAVPPRSQSATSGYRHPKAVRANMPPDHVQAGALGSGSTGFL